jgi:hypothetical protein
MRTNLLETYSRQLKVAEAYVAKNFDGKTVSANTQLTTAVLLDNTNRWMTESMNMVAGGNRTDLGDWKKFCLNLTNIAVPSLIANDLVIVHPMTSYSGSVAYLKYVAASEKNGMEGRTLNSVFAHGEMDDARMYYASPVVVETVTADEDGALSALSMTPVIGGFVVREGNKADGTASDMAVKYTYKIDGKYTNELKAGKVAYKAAEGNDWQMDHVPATKIPSIAPKMERIALVAEPRRIAVRYDQITAFQAKTDYGFSLDKQIAEQACGELAYEIDTEIVDMLYRAAFSRTKINDKGETVADIVEFNKRQPIGVSKFEHYNAFLEVVEEAKAIIYKRTRKFHPNYMVIGSDVLPVLRFVNGFTAVKNAKMNGPYKVGELDGLDVYVSPAIEGSEFFFGLNGSDMMSSAGVYAPYMAIVPTQLLGTPDGGLTQGFSTWYAKALLNELLLVGGKIVDKVREDSI